MIVINWSIGVLVGMMVAVIGVTDIYVGLIPSASPNFLD